LDDFVLRAQGERNTAFYAGYRPQNRYGRGGPVETQPRSHEPEKHDHKLVGGPAEHGRRARKPFRRRRRRRHVVRCVTKILLVGSSRAGFRGLGHTHAHAHREFFFFFYRNFVSAQFVSTIAHEKK